MMILILKILVTGVLGTAGILFFIAVVLKNSYINYIRKYGKKIKARITGKKLIQNSDCNGMPGYHFLIKFEWQRGDDIESDIYRSPWRYYPKFIAEKRLAGYKENSYVEVYRDRDHECECFPASATKMDLAYPLLLLIICTGLIFLIW